MEGVTAWIEMAKGQSDNLTQNKNRNAHNRIVKSSNYLSPSPNVMCYFKAITIITANVSTIYLYSEEKNSQNENYDYFLFRYYNTDTRI